MFHLGWFAPGGVQGWGTPDYDPSYDWSRGTLYQDMAKRLEAACLDFILIEDASAVPDEYGGSFDTYLRLAVAAPKFDPAVVATLMADATSQIGIIPTLTTTFYPPFLLARLTATMDHMSGGRIGWNVVTSSSDPAAQNYGLDGLPEHDTRYDIADEYLALCQSLWSSWDSDAVEADPVSNVFADHTKVHRINFEGRHYRSRGPLNVPQPPQGRPVLAQAGNSGRGRLFAARHADIVLTPINHPAGLKAFRAEIRNIAATFGRDPDRVKVMSVVNPRIFASAQEAEAARRRPVADIVVVRLLALVSSITGIDLSRFDLDTPLPDDVSTNGSLGTLDWLRRGNATPRTIALRMGRLTEADPFAGTAEQVAREMAETMEEVGGDGFLINGPLVPGFVGRIVDGLIPALQTQGLVRRSYAHATFRENLLSF